VSNPSAQDRLLRGVRPDGQEAPSERPLAPQRLLAIRDLVRERGGVRSTELVERFAVTAETIRRDLVQLAEMGVIQRTYGGAVAVDANDEPVPEYSGRLLEQPDEKRWIGEWAAQLVEDGDAIIVDAGTTTLCLVQALRGKRDIVVATNAMPHALELMTYPGITVLLIGGLVKVGTLSTVGDLAIAAVRELQVRRTFLASWSVSARGGLTDLQLDEVGIKRAMIRAASEVILLADHTKFGRESVMQIAPLDAIQRIVTSEGIDPAEAEAIRNLGVELHIVGPHASAGASAGEDSRAISD
jgi:DeoR/GlpR family transcriptional regulator of sugar metabolism